MYIKRDSVSIYNKTIKNLTLNGGNMGDFFLFNPYLLFSCNEHILFIYVVWEAEKRLAWRQQTSSFSEQHWNWFQIFHRLLRLHCVCKGQGMAFLPVCWAQKFPSPHSIIYFTYPNMLWKNYLHTHTQKKSLKKNHKYQS